VSWFLVVDKPAGITSHDVVAMVRAVTGFKKVGHTGTLDPFATGVLPLALGRATRLIRFLDEDHKVYDATIALGQRTDTGDPTGEVLDEAPVPVLDEDTVRAVLASFLGVRQQVPPRYSAVKVAGRPLYSYARKGEDVQARARPVRIDAVDLLDLQTDSLRVRITCGRGTYARVLADEIAMALGTAGHLSALRREASGPFSLTGALTLERLAELATDEDASSWRAVLRPARGAERVPWRSRQAVRAGLEPWLVPPGAVLGHLPAVQLGRGALAQLQRAGTAPPPPPEVGEGDFYAALHADQLIAVIRREKAAGRVAAMVVPG